MSRREGRAPGAPRSPAPRSDAMFSESNAHTQLERKDGPRDPWRWPDALPSAPGRSCLQRSGQGLTCLHGAVVAVINSSVLDLV